MKSDEIKTVELKDCTLKIRRVAGCYIVSVEDKNKQTKTKNGKS